MREDAFGTYHPVINFSFFIGAIAFCMFLRHPAFLTIAAVFSATYYLSIRGRSGIKVVCGMVPLFVMLSVMNPLFNPMGETVLFTYLDGRAYTWESLAFGMSTGAMFVSMMLWFASYNAIMTSDKFTYLFGSVAPSLSLVFTMVLRLVPNYQRKIAQFATARSCVGKLAVGGSRADKVENGVALLSVLTTWALENAVTIADSMRSRGYGVVRRTSFSIYRFAARDAFLLASMAVLAALVLVCVTLGAANVEYLPVIVLPETGAMFFLGLIAYAVLLALPTIVNMREALIWRISLSKI